MFLVTVVDIFNEVVVIGPCQKELKLDTKGNSTFMTNKITHKTAKFWIVSMDEKKRTEFPTKTNKNHLC